MIPPLQILWHSTAWSGRSEKKPEPSKPRGSSAARCCISERSEAEHLWLSPATSALRLSDADFAVVLDEIETLLSGSKDSQQHFDCDGLPCPSIRNSISIDCMGNIYPCNSWFYKVGNINETTLADIWNHSEGYRYLNSLRNSDLHECCSCDLRDCCTRCPGNALLEDGDMLKCSTLDRRYALLSSRR